MKIGIFFGGSSREREISFAGGRTVYDNLDKRFFEAVPIFVDSTGAMCVLNWEFVYKGSIRDFYPPREFVPDEFEGIEIYDDSIANYSRSFRKKMLSEIGRPINVEELREEIDFAFLALHGRDGEDGSIQGLLGFLGIPFSGAGILASAIGMDKDFQKSMSAGFSFAGTKTHTLNRADWFSNNRDHELATIKKKVGFPCVTRPANQGSSIGVGLHKTDDQESISRKIDEAFFVEKLSAAKWNSFTEKEKIEELHRICDIRSGIGLPLSLTVEGDPQNSTSREASKQLVYLPINLFHLLNKNADLGKDCSLIAIDKEAQVLAEEFLSGREFSCIVLQHENGKLLALPPTEIVKGDHIYDYRSKYLPGMSRKLTPIDLPDLQVDAIREACCELFDHFKFQVYARIDGFISEEGEVTLNDPNTTSGMLPSSFFFHQAAEIGLNPSQFLTLIIRASLVAREREIGSGLIAAKLLKELDNDLQEKALSEKNKKRIAVILGGYSSERHISVESGRNIFEKLSSSEEWEPIPVFLTGDENAYELWTIPVNILLKDNADDIAAKLVVEVENKSLNKIRKESKNWTRPFVGKELNFTAEKTELQQLCENVSFVFLALHGRPGEDGVIQKDLEKWGMPYNGSGPKSSGITINKWDTNQLLKENDFVISDQLLIDPDAFENKDIASRLSDCGINFPLIAKPVDDGCSSAVKKIEEISQLNYFAQAVFRQEEEMSTELEQRLDLKRKEEFPMKSQFLIEELTTAQGASHFLEITGGLLCSYKDGELHYEMFQPSEALATTAILSLEEKFLAGQGKNITPPRFSTDKDESERISTLVRAELERAARILGVEGYARIDAFVRIFADGKVETIVIEVNSLPGMTPATAIFHQAAFNGYKPLQFLKKIIEFSLERHAQKLA